VLEPGHGQGLGPKSVQLLLLGVRASQDHLEGHQPVQADLPGLVHDPHAAAGDFLQ